MSGTYSVGGRHYGEIINETMHENIVPETQKLVKIIEGTCIYCGWSKSQVFSK